MKNALAAQKSAGMTRSRGYGAVREAISGAGGRILDVLGRKNLMRHEIDKQTQAEKALSDIEGERAGYKSTLQAEGAGQDIRYLERKAELDAQAEADKIEDLKKRGYWWAFLEGERAGHPIQDGDERNRPVMEWLLGTWDAYRTDHPELMVYDEMSQRDVFQREDVRWEEVKDFMILTMKGDRDMQQMFINKETGQYDEEEFAAFVDGWISTMKNEQVHPSSGEAFHRFARGFGEDKTSAITEVQATIKKLAGTGLIEKLPEADQAQIRAVETSPDTQSAENIQLALALVRSLMDAFQRMEYREPREGQSAFDLIQSAGENVPKAGE
jgi:hypothetical protein